ncbi:protein COFACTOR ASSEMBLY OF COMPLEX C SUBUNIT B CCB4, chloroplastic isoform X4 [Diospyros lotus]|uniref:protein COFACTOR ASSEMBLY OF COMPLEX C SUBUNIT B CCB4, chloroplastic isoform X4 n=1 Tax=Diospyros lotus TaxID=55363 RepID=UPI00225243D5|nr:protein COFACTOR ASSEMBLY OF COMPLEX C SUBUNIT B CCB4, chloroplastic isoform X4 [Diospyros lotus]
MEAGTLLLRPIVITAPIWNPKRRSFLRRCVPALLRSVRASSNLQGGYRGPKPRREWAADLVSENDDVVRSMPIYVGVLSLLAVLFNRAVSGIAPVADASRVWESLSVATCSRSLVIVYDNNFIFQTGFAAASSANYSEVVPVVPNNLMEGSLYKSVLKSGSQSYLANLSLYPGKSELPFLPPNTQQAVILQPLGDKGIAIIGGDTIRGFTTSDQAWISLIAEKLDATLTKFLNKPPMMVQDIA